MTAHAPFTSTAPPRVHLLVAAPGASPASRIAAPPGFVVRVADGRRGRTKAALLSELARALDAPESCARNWDAFEECLADLEWLPAAGYVLAVTDADQILADAPEDYRTFIEIVENVAREWATARRGAWPRAAVPFHVCLVVPRGRETAREWRAPLLDG
jgi:hypothetical protein